MAGAPQHPGTFWKASPSHTILITRGDKVRHFVVKPWVAKTSFLAGIVFLATAVGAISLQLAGPQLIENLQIREAKAGAAYEARIADLRKQLDGFKTRQHLDREALHSQVSSLLQKQGALTDRFDQLAPLLRIAQGEGLVSAGEAPSEAGTFSKTSVDDEPLRKSLGDLRAYTQGTADTQHLLYKILPTLDVIVRQIDGKQAASTAALADRAKSKADRIRQSLASEGISVPSASDEDVGGPLVPLSDGDVLLTSIDRLEQELDALAQLRRTINALPLGDPMPNGRRTSSFGVRKDPFLGTQVLHTGVDFAAAEGTAVRPTASGRVTFAGENSGYGLMIEVDHGNGVSTRYGHLSSIKTNIGADVGPETLIGLVGSTGRSTGPHLHYEVRRYGEAINPERYIRAGRKLALLTQATENE